jgi:glucosamine 6-phosphate synthetase-like amidotransferase/phosphosugar isomerase protein
MHLVRVLAQVNERRGPHAFGFAYRTPQGGLGAYKQPGRITDAIERLDALHDAEAIVGHTRWVTMGSPENNDNNHPHAVRSKSERGWLVVNGTITDAAVMADAFNLTWQTECDSELIGARFAQRRHRSYGSRLAAAVSDALDFTEKPHLSAALLSSKRLAVVRAGKPLWYRASREGVYFSSAKPYSHFGFREWKNGLAATLGRSGRVYEYADAVLNYGERDRMLF